MEPHSPIYPHSPMPLSYEAAKHLAAQMDFHGSLRNKPEDAYKNALKMITVLRDISNGVTKIDEVTGAEYTPKERLYHSYLSVELEHLTKLRFDGYSEAAAKSEASTIFEFYKKTEPDEAKVIIHSIADNRSIISLGRIKKDYTIDLEYSPEEMEYHGNVSDQLLLLTKADADFGPYSPSQ